MTSTGETDEGRPAPSAEAEARERRPMLLVVDDQSAAVVVCDQLERRYGLDYHVVGVASADAARRHLEESDEDGGLALLLVDHATAGADELLARARVLRPLAKRGLLFTQGSRQAFEVVPRAMTHGLIDFFVSKPINEPDEQFHAAITEFLYEWSRTEPPDAVAVHVVADGSSAKAFEIRDLLERNSVPYAFHAVDGPEGAARLARLGVRADETPVFEFHEGSVLVDPEYDEVVRVLGATFDARRDVDVAIVGGGPAGLAAAVYAASEGLSTVVVEREAIGGQAGSSSLIRNYLGFPHGVAGRELAARALRQAWAFGAQFVWMHGAVSLASTPGGLAVGLADGSELVARSVVVASGVRWRRLEAPGLDRLLGAGAFYGAAVSEASAMADGSVFVVGGGNSAAQAAVNLARYARRVVVVVRGASLASTMSEYLVHALAAADNIEVRLRSTVTRCSGDDHLESVTLCDAVTGTEVDEPADGLFVLIGGEPHTDWLPADVACDRWGFIATGADVLDEDVVARRWPLDRPPLPFETSLPGVFAVGDVRHGSMKRVASAVGEGASAVHSCHRYLDLSSPSR